MKRFFLTATLALAMALTSVTAKAADASVYVIHGINGIDLGLTDPELPVDVSVNGACAIPNFQFGQVVGPISLPAGSYDIAISLADADDPCSQPAVIAATVPLASDKSYSIIAHLDATGVPTASVFENDLSALSPGTSRVIAHHAAWAPAVDVTVQRDAYDPKSPKLVITDFVNREQAPATTRPGDWYVSLAPTGTSDVVLGPAMVSLEPYKTYLVYAVGSATNGTLALIAKDVYVGKAKSKSGKR